jgi:cyclophilin family peptidyl-prolyl cis-trans isomerase
VALYMFGMNGSNSSNSPGENNSNTPSGNMVLLQTSMGNITIQLRDDKPTTTNNFKNLVQKGVYDGTIFHRVIADFMIQGGMNTSASVATIPDEIGNNNHNVIGTVAMAKTSQPNSATSQFFINVADNSKITYQDGTKFDETYTVFGTVTSGMNVVNAISQVATDSNDKPLTDVTLIKAEIIS